MTLVCRRKHIPTLECIFFHLRTRTGLFLIGAGASAGLSPLGAAFWRTSPLHYLKEARSFAPTAAPRVLLTQRMIDHSGIAIQDVFPNRELRPGSSEYPLLERLNRLPDAFARENLKHVLARVRYLARTEGTTTDSYRVFHGLFPSIIADYNHDGLAREFCGPTHAIVEMHGTIHPRYGSPEFGAQIANMAEFDVTLPGDNLVMGIPESWADAQLRQRLSWVMSSSPQYIAIIGYSFAKMGSGYDDAVSLASFVRRFKHYPGAIFVISPDPTQLCEMLSDALKISTVYPVKRYWNVLAHAYLKMKQDEEKFRSLDNAYGFLFDRYGSDQVFPILQQV
ncbi:hypothetical protein [Rhodopseudomonas sp.]|uniref:hypothetical protein n=1 Tax=Rhodopseudomonas sp. TaxID=1078 RepID=UPI003B3A69EC